MAERPLTMVTAGHIDHGKTSLVRALTGRDTDRLPEERRRGISIALGFAELDLGGGRTISIVDVPGHERLVKTMVSGAGGSELYLLTIAADDGPMPQTHEHLAVLRALGIEPGVVAITRCDLVGDREIEALRARICDLVPGVPTVAVSAHTDTGIQELKDAIARCADDARSAVTEPKDWPEQTILHIDRSFSLQGIGTVITGTLRSGTIAVDDPLELLPQGRPVRARQVHVHERAVERAVAGGRVAINLAGVRSGEVDPGDVIASPTSSLRPSYRLDVALALPPGATALAGERVQVHHGSRDAAARVVELDEGAGLFQLRLESQLLARAGERVVLRRLAPPDTLGGGVVVDAAPPRHSGRAGAARARLIRTGEPEAVLSLALDDQPRSLDADPYLWRGEPLLEPCLERFSPARWREAVARLKASGELAVERGRISRPSPSANRVRNRPAPDLDERAGRALEILRDDHLEPRAPAHLAAELGLERAQTVALLNELAAAKRVALVKPGIYYVPEALVEARREVEALASRDGAVTVAGLRDSLGTSRKYSQALLEHFDSESITIRRGDRHELRRRARR